MSFKLCWKDFRLTPYYECMMTPAGHLLIMKETDLYPVMEQDKAQNSFTVSLNMSLLNVMCLL